MWDGDHMEPAPAGARGEDILECEKWTTFVLLIFVGGYLGAFTYSIRGGVFCNAQTANFVLSAVALGSGDLHEFFYYFIPMTAYFLGAFISESVPNYIKIHFHIRWDTLFLLIEMLAVVFLGLLPESAPYRITHVTVNLIASMQYNTFRQTRHIPMATTFCTNHLRQVGVAASKALRHRDRASAQRMLFHCGMLLSFVTGAVLATVLCRWFQGKGVLFVLLPLGYLFADLLWEDIRSGRDRLARKPAGH